jgi:hypothetical protein
MLICVTLCARAASEEKATREAERSVGPNRDWLGRQRINFRLPSLAQRQQRKAQRRTAINFTTGTSFNDEVRKSAKEKIRKLTLFVIGSFCSCAPTRKHGRLTWRTPTPSTTATTAKLAKICSAVQ